MDDPNNLEWLNRFIASIDVQIHGKKLAFLTFCIPLSMQTITWEYLIALSKMTENIFLLPLMSSHKKLNFKPLLFFENIVV